MARTKKKPVSARRPLPDAQTIGFRARVRFRRWDPETDETLGLSPGQAFDVVARRPACLSIVEDHDDPMVNRKIEVVGHYCEKSLGVFKSNGTRQLEFDDKHGYYLEGPASPTLTGIRSPMGLPSIFEPKLLFSSLPLGRLGEVRRAQSREDRPGGWLLRARPHPGYRFDMRLAVYRGALLPERISAYHHGKTRKWVLFFRTELVDWRFDFDAPDSLFDPSLPPGAVPHRVLGDEGILYKTGA